MTEPVPALSGERDVTLVPMPRQGSGHTDWRRLAGMLAADAPTPEPGAPRIPVPGEWVEIPVAGFDQTLFFEAGSRYAGIMPRVTTRRVSEEGTPGAPTSPATLLQAQAPVDGLLLGVEPWTAGRWRGVHAAWSLSQYGSTVLRRCWILAAGASEESGYIEVLAEYNAYAAPYLGVMVSSLAAGLGPAPDAGSGSSDLLGDLEGDLEWSAARAEDARRLLSGDTGRHVLPQAFTLASGDLEWLRDAGAPAERTITTPATPRRVIGTGLAGTDGVLTESGRTMSRLARRAATEDADLSVESGRPGVASGQPEDVGWVSPAGQACLVRRLMSAADGVGRGVEVGAYRRDDAPDMVLRLVGHRPEGPSDVPVDLLPADVFAARLADPAEPLPAALPEGARVSGHMDAQTIYRWWTADWSWWSVHRTVTDARTGGAGVVPDVTEGIRVLTVRGFGHYLWDAGGDAGADATGPGGLGSTVRLQAVDGLALFGVLAALVGPDPAASGGPAQAGP